MIVCHLKYLKLGTGACLSLNGKNSFGFEKTTLLLVSRVTKTKVECENRQNLNI